MEDAVTPLKRRTMLQLSAGIGLLWGSSAVGSGQTGGEAWTSPPDRSTSDAVESTRVGPDDEPLDVLLLKDCNPWDVPANEMALDDLGYTYQLLTSADAVDRLGSDVAINDFDTVVIPTTQSAAYYDNLNAIWDRIEGFVQDGGTLVVHGGEKGWPCNSFEDRLQFPGDVESVYNFELTGENIPELQELSVVDDDHPVTEGLTGEDLSYWASDISSFGYLSGLPEDATTVVGLRIDPVAHPTYVEYPFGDGRVLTTMMGPEWPFGTDRAGTEAFLRNELEYAVETEPSAGPEPEPSKGQIAGSVTTADGTAAAGADVYLVDTVSQYQVVDFVDGNGTLPEPVAATTTDADGQFLLESLDPERYLLVVVPEAPHEPTYERLGVPADETTSVSVTVEADRHLAQFDRELRRIRDAAKANVRDGTDDVSEVYVDGAQLFNGELGLSDYLSLMLDVTNLALGLQVPGGTITASAEIKSFAAEHLAIPLAEFGHHRVLTERWKEVNGTRYQDELVTYTQTCRNISWITNLESTSSVGAARTRFSNTDVYLDTMDAIDATFDRYDQDVAYRDPGDEFPVGEVKSVLETQARWLEGNGIAPGTAITPAGNAYVTREARYHAGYYDGLRRDYDVAEGVEMVSSGVSAAGKGLMIVGGPYGLVASVAGWAGSMAMSMYQVHLKNKIGDAWVNSLTYWVSDLYDARAVTDELVNWLVGQLDEPTVESVDGRIDGVDLGGVNVFGTTYALANEPSYPDWWSAALPDPKWQRVATNTVTVTNTGSTTADARIIAVDTYGDGRTSGVSDAVSFAPDPDRAGEDVVRLAPGETRELEHEYASDFHPFDPFNWHYMSTTLWMSGKYVDESEQPYYVVPNLDLIPSPLAYDGERLPATDEASRDELLDAPLQTDSYVVTDGSKADREPLTVADWTEYVGEIESLVEGEVQPGEPSVSTTVEVDSGTAGIVFVLGTTPDAELNLHVRDGLGNHVGYEPSVDGDAVEIPGASYNGHESTIEVVSIEDAAGSFQVEASAVSFTTDAPLPVSLYAVEIPERDAVLTVSPASVGSLLWEGTAASTTVEVGETGKQTGIDVTDVRVGRFETENGQPLSDVAVTVSASQFALGPGERQPVALEYDAAASVSLDGADPKTRFEAPVTVETASTGTAEVTASVLVLDTDVPDARLADATSDVDGVHLSAVDAGQLPSEPPGDGTVVAAYELEAGGSGEVAVAVPFGSLENPRAYALKQGNWTSQQSFVGDDLVVRVEVPTDGLTVAVAEQPSGPPAVADFADPPTDPNDDGLYEDVNGDGVFDMADARALFDNLDDDVVQNNVAAFDFNGDGRVDVVDVQRLVNMLS